MYLLYIYFKVVKKRFLLYFCYKKAKICDINYKTCIEICLNFFFYYVSVYLYLKERI